MYERSGRPDETSWRATRETRPGHEETHRWNRAIRSWMRCLVTDRGDDINSQEEARPQQFVIGNDDTELELSKELRSFVNRANDQVRKRQKRISNVTGDGEEHSMIW